MATKEMEKTASALAIAFGITLAGAHSVNASETCKLNSSETHKTCVVWQRPVAPIEDQDFTVDYACAGCAAAPEVVLTTNDDQWEVYAIVPTLDLIPARADIGTLTLNGSGNFTVAITLGGDEGADNIGLIDLTPIGDHSGSLAPGSAVLGDVTGDVIAPATAAGAGGVVNLDVAGSLAGNVDCREVASLKVGTAITGGGVTGNIDADDDITFLDIADAMSGNIAAGGDITLLDIGGPLTGNITAGNDLVDGDVGADMTGNVSVTSTIHDLGVGGNLTGNVTADWVQNSLSITGNYDRAMRLSNLAASSSLVIGGDVLSTASILISVSMGFYSEVHVLGDFAGTLQVANVLRASVILHSDVASTGSITISDMSGVLFGASLVDLGANSATSTMNGSAKFPKGVPAHCVVGMGGALGPNGSIDLMNKDVAGTLIVARGGSGKILNGSAVVGGGVTPFLIAVALGLPLNSGGHTFSGSATFASVDSGSKILVGGGDVSGDVMITGAMDGDIIIEPDASGDGGTLLAGGLIQVIGACSGSISISGAADGDVMVKNDMSGNLDVGESLSGDFAVSGDFTGIATIGRKLQATGRIMVAGLLNGGIEIGDETVALSQITGTDGLGANGCIQINTNQGDFDASGTMHFGPATIPFPLNSITFDGGIKIWDQASAGNGGDLDGTITVTGCHANACDLDVCIDGANNGTVTLNQGGCTNQIGYSCDPTGIGCDAACP
ncbi:MAG: hypothetical protein ACE5E5_15090 [Phycisphaerae bacterium]